MLGTSREFSAASERDDDIRTSCGLRWPMPHDYCLETLQDRGSHLTYTDGSSPNLLLHATPNDVFKNSQIIALI